VSRGLSFLCLNSTDNDVLSRLSTLIHCRFPVLCSHTPQSCHRFEICVSFLTPPIPVDGSYTPCLSCVAISFVFLVLGQSPSPNCLRCPYLVVMSSLLFHMRSSCPRVVRICVYRLPPARLVSVLCWFLHPTRRPSVCLLFFFCRSCRQGLKRKRDPPSTFSTH
jgi:hypothetical protein